MSTTPLSVQAYSVREAFFADPVEAFRRLEAAGLVNVELFGLPDFTDAYRAGFDATALRPSSSHAAILGVDAAGLESAFVAAVDLGVETLISPGTDRRWGDRAFVTDIATELNAAAERAADHGLRVGYHNHWWELESNSGTTGLELFADLLDPSVVLEVDTYWAAVAGADVPVLLRALGERVTFLHIKDGAIDDDPKSQQPAGRGAMDIPAVLAAAPTATRVIEFDDYLGDVFEGIGQSVAYLSAL